VKSASTLDVLVADQQDLSAGPFSSWIDRTLAAQDTRVGADVPCGSCTACCRSSKFIHIAPDETETLRRVPRELQFAAPGLPAGTVLMGYDEHGQCPMFVDGGCSIYEHRPRTCRNYDCRIFPATGLSPDDDDQALITEQARRWRFDFRSALDRQKHEAVLAATDFLREQTASLPAGQAPRSSSVAMAALKAHRAFLQLDEVSGETVLVSPDAETVRAALSG
jgi:Fe-S-cluster containining protein